MLAHTERFELERARDRLVAALVRGGPLWQQVYADEGLYVVEHILLRPLAPATRHADAGFYGQRISVLFPAWPLRFRNVRLRELAESLLARHAPAHLACDCYWIEFTEMQEFEDLYARWSAARFEAARNPRHDRMSLDRHALALRHFLDGLAAGGTT